jgi:hypothetical protein
LKTPSLLLLSMLALDLSSLPGCTDGNPRPEAPIERAAGVPTTSPDVSIRIGWGCITLPRRFQVFQIQTGLADQAHGRIVSKGTPEVQWSFGLSEANPLCLKECRIVDRWTERLGESTYSLGVMEDAGTRAYFAAGDLVSFRIVGASQDSLEYLRFVAQRYKRIEHPESCQPATPTDTGFFEDTPSASAQQTPAGQRVVVAPNKALQRTRLLPGSP